MIAALSPEFPLTAAATGTNPSSPPASVCPAATGSDRLVILNVAYG
jgi:hypothetical protein